MSSVVGHALAGISIGSVFKRNETGGKRWKLLVLTAFLAIVPDLDIVIYILFRPSGMTPHRGASHTLIFTAILGLIAALSCGRYVGLARLRAFMIFYGVLLSHLLLDYLMGCGPGVQFFWPFWDRAYLFPIKIVPTAFYGQDTRSLFSILFYPLTLYGILLEIIIFLPLFLLSRSETLFSRSRLIFVSAAGLLFSILFYNGWLQSIR